MTGMNLDKSKPAAWQRRAAAGKIAHHLSDLVHRERLDDRARARVEHGSAMAGTPDGDSCTSITGLHAAVEKLNTELRVVLMDRVDQFLEDGMWRS